MSEKEIKFIEWEQEKIQLLADALENYRSEFIKHMKDPNFFTNGGPKDELIKSFNDLASQYNIPTGPWFLKFIRDNSSAIATSLLSNPSVQSTSNWNMEKPLIVAAKYIENDPLFRLLSLFELIDDTMPAEISTMFDSKKLAQRLLSYKKDNVSVSQEQEVWKERELTQEELRVALEKYNGGVSKKDEKCTLSPNWKVLITTYILVQLENYKEGTIREAIKLIENARAEGLLKQQFSKKKKTN